MKTIKYLALALVGVFFLTVSCKDDKELVPVWESAVNGFAEVADGSEDNFVFGYPALGVTYDFQWISADSKNTVTKIDFYVLFNEPYKDADGNDAVAKHAGDDGILLTSLEGGNVPANRVNSTLTVTQADVYNLYKDVTFDYDGNGPNPAIAVFGATPNNADRDAINRFVTDDVISIRWVLTTADGRVFGKVANGTGWSPSVCTEVPGSNCELTWSVVDPADSAPKATLSLAKGKMLKDASKDTVFISFNKEVGNIPTLALETTNGTAPSAGAIGTPALYKDSETKYFAIYTAPADYTGGVKVTASASATAGSAPFGGLVMAPKSITVNVDNTAPEGIGNGNIYLGEGQTATVKVTFNEAMSTEAADSIYVTITGQNMDDFIDQRMTLAADGKSATIAYEYSDEDDAVDATSGALTILVEGGKDIAGNDLVVISQPVVTIDLNTPTGVSVTLAAPYDFGNQIKLASSSITNPGGSTSGTIYWVAVETTDPAPVHPFDTDDAVASGSFARFSSGVQYIDFAPNGNYHLYFYTITSTGNKSDFTVAPLAITMALNP
jgi:hypothetical protein